MTHVLIVANQTAGGRHLHDAVRSRMREDDCTFTLLVPATRPHGSATWTDGQARALAKRRADAAAESLRDLGTEVETVIGVAPTPIDCVRDLLRDRDFDEVIVSTYPHPISHWLRMDLPSRIAYHSGLPVMHIVARTKETVGAA